MKLLRMGGIEQPVQYKRLNSLCFRCGRVGHKVEKCSYTVRMQEGKGDADGRRMTFEANLALRREKRLVRGF